MGFTMDRARQHYILKKEEIHIQGIYLYELGITCKKGLAQITKLLTSASPSDWLKQRFLNIINDKVAENGETENTSIFNKLNFQLLQ